MPFVGEVYSSMLANGQGEKAFFTQVAIQGVVSLLARCWRHMDFSPTVRSYTASSFTPQACPYHLAPAELLSLTAVLMSVLPAVMHIHSPLLILSVCAVASLFGQWFPFIGCDGDFTVTSVIC